MPHYFASFLLARKIEIKKFRTFMQQVGGYQQIRYLMLLKGDLAGAIQQWCGLWEVLGVARGWRLHHGFVFWNNDPELYHGLRNC